MTHQPERRQADRQRVLKGGKVFYKNYSISMDCTIKDESSTGMKIKMDANCALPSDVALLNRKDGKLADAHIVWKHGDLLGVKFSSKMEDVRSFAKADIRRMSIIATRG
ncbi:PilZ domain-containing protein [Cohaesibacter celericrescens]|uniref:PilZ domain-containing protein n=1 Tax=Cohaesibacter celericrescens TaxID=2067669 RepID=UPI0015E0DDF3|nr:PilZ domain-containing protein [Cohaesibacter celericrescens]